jgi:hypothetical protein
MAEKSRIALKQAPNVGIIQTITMCKFRDKEMTNR